MSSTKNLVDLTQHLIVVAGNTFFFTAKCSGIVQIQNIVYIAIILDFFILQVIK